MHNKSHSCDTRGHCCIAEERVFSSEEVGIQYEILRRLKQKKETRGMDAVAPICKSHIIAGWICGRS